MNYYTAKEVNTGFRGFVYTYDEKGEKEISVWKSERIYNTAEEAVDAAVEWAEENDVEVELG
jgi:hypothetical protein